MFRRAVQGRGIGQTASRLAALTPRLRDPNAFVQTCPPHAHAVTYGASPFRTGARSAGRYRRYPAGGAPSVGCRGYERGWGVRRVGLAIVPVPSSISVAENQTGLTATFQVTNNYASSIDIWAPRCSRTGSVASCGGYSPTSKTLAPGQTITATVGYTTSFRRVGHSNHALVALCAGWGQPAK